MSMTFARINLNTHKSDGMLNRIKKPVKIGTDVRANDLIVVPVPYHFARSGFYSLGADVSRYAKLRKVAVKHSARFNGSPEIVLAQLWSIHANGELAYIDQCTDFMCQQ